MELHEDTVLPLRPFGGWMTELAHTYSIELKNLIIINIPESTRRLYSAGYYQASEINRKEAVGEVWKRDDYDGVCGTGVGVSLL